jgi:hypothetical protein
VHAKILRQLRESHRRSQADEARGLPAALLGRVTAII